MRRTIITEKRREDNLRAAHRYYEAHREKILETKRQYREANREKMRRYYQSHKARIRRQQLRHRSLLKQKVLTHYGNGKCACVKCGYDENIAALSIDHIQGGGGKHIRELAGDFYRWLKKNGFPEGYQTLCMNCQFIKKIEERENSAIQKIKRNWALMKSLPGETDAKT